MREEAHQEIYSLIIDYIDDNEMNFDEIIVPKLNAIFDRIHNAAVDECNESCGRHFTFTHLKKPLANP